MHIFVIIIFIHPQSVLNRVTGPVCLTLAGSEADHMEGGPGTGHS